MKFISVVTLLAAPFVVSSTRIAWDAAYDNGSQSLATVSCSNGANGMLTKGYHIFRDLPTFPNIGGSSAIAGWNSPNCGSSKFPKFAFVTDPRGSPYLTGSCWNITYHGKTITVTVIDHADGYNLSEEGMNTLTCVGILPLSSPRFVLLIRVVATGMP